MKFFLPIVCILLSTVSFGQLNQDFLTLNQQEREFYEFIPSNYSNTEAAPLIIVLHGIGGYASDYATYGLNDIADTARFIPVYLQGTNNAFNQPSWNNGVAFGNSTSDDLLFISSIIDSMHAKYNINRRRVYLTGISMGAIMSFKAIRHLSDEIAATVCHIGTMSDEDIIGSNPTYPVPTMQVHGTLDNIVPYSSSPLASLSLVPTTINKLKTLNGWNGADSTIIDIPNTVADGIMIERIIYDCTTPLEHWKMNGAQHIVLFANTNDTSGMVITWNFLRQFTHTNTSLSIQDQNQEHILKPLVYPNPSAGQLNIENIEQETLIQIYNLNQQLIVEQIFNSQSIDISLLPSGLYVLKLSTKSGQAYSQLITKE